jgi:threonine/homoserine/homoserine lactone efflux protein
MIISLSQALSFLVAAMILTISPGPDNLMILSIGLSKGQKQGIAFGVGCALGCLTHTLLVSAGLSALIAASETALTILKIAGGLYLIWLGIQSLKSRGINWHQQADVAINDMPISRYFIRGLIANAINPKVILFFLALLPRFIHHQESHIGWQSAQLGLLFTLQAIVIFGLIGLFAGSIGEKLKANPAVSIWLDRVAGLLFIVLGVSLQFAQLQTFQQH